MVTGSRSVTRRENLLRICLSLESRVVKCSNYFFFGGIFQDWGFPVDKELVLRSCHWSCIIIFDRPSVAREGTQMFYFFRTPERPIESSVDFFSITNGNGCTGLCFCALDIFGWIRRFISSSSPYLLLFLHRRGWANSTDSFGCVKWCISPSLTGVFGLTHPLRKKLFSPLISIFSPLQRRLFFLSDGQKNRL